MKNTVPVTVVVTTFNDGGLLGEALDSVSAQRVQPAEIIVLDDGSEPATAPDIIERRGSALGSRVRYHRQENAGPSAARNRGLGMASHPYIAYLDADDRWRPEHLALKVERMNALPNTYSTVYDAFVEFDHATGRVLKTIAVGAYDGLIAKARIGVPGGVPAGMPFQLHRVSALRAIDGFDSALRVNEDFDVLLRLAVEGWHMAGSSTVTVERRVHGLSLTSRDPIATLDATEQFLAKAERLGLLDAEALASRRKWARLSAGKKLLEQGGSVDRASNVIAEAFEYAPPLGPAQNVLFAVTRSRVVARVALGAYGALRRLAAFSGRGAR